MTEREAIEVLNNFDMQVSAKADGAYQSTIGKMACEVATMALTEIQQYRAIGTAEECQEARELQNPKRPNMWGDGCDDEGGIIYDMYDCPNCGTT